MLSEDRAQLVGGQPLGLVSAEGADRLLKSRSKCLARRSMPSRAASGVVGLVMLLANADDDPGVGETCQC